MLSKRIITSSILIIVAILSVVNNWIFVIVVSALIILGLWEFFGLVEKKGIHIYKYFGVVIGAIIPLSIYFRFELTKNWELLFIVLALLFIFLLQFTRRETSDALSGISTTLFGVLYVAWFFSFLIKVKLLPFGSGLLAFILLVTKLGDIGAYLVGTKWGRRALIARISPKKSIEGAVGGLVFSILAAVASKPLLPNHTIFSYWRLVLVGAFFGVVGQLGDLSESLIKRDCQVKDTGRFLPGLGGVLDMMDSLLFTAPAFYFYMSSILTSR
ncbi:MAG: phosphatidate cytidylyltransferase [Candidatus Omnitrophota bacterium]|nr:phosphatidate cytidylyltransferase [Candidatus Omnitrophota bacterium]